MFFIGSLCLSKCFYVNAKEYLFLDDVPTAGVSTGLDITQGFHFNEMEYSNSSYETTLRRESRRILKCFYVNARWPLHMVQHTYSVNHVRF